MAGMAGEWFLMGPSEAGEKKVPSAEWPSNVREDKQKHVFLRPFQGWTDQR